MTEPVRCYSTFDKSECWERRRLWLKQL